MKRRWIISILAALLLGALINVIVAWGCCLYGYRKPSAFVPTRPSTDADLTWWRWVNPPQGVMEPTSRWPHEVVGYAELRLVGPGPTVTSPSGQRSQITSTANWNEAGWPMRSLRGVWFGIPDPAKGKAAWTREYRGAMDMPHVFPNSFPRRAPVIPWWPKFPEFLVNTLFYAAIVWLLRMTPPALRWCWRRKHGRCTNCGYDLRGAQSATCPECGAAVTTRPGTNTAMNRPA